MRTSTSSGNIDAKRFSPPQTPPPLSQSRSKRTSRTEAFQVVEGMVLGIFLALLTACGKPPEAAPTMPTPVVLPTHYKSLTIAEAEDLMRTNKRLGIIDARGQDEMRAGDGWIPGARPFNYLAGDDGLLTTLDRDQPWLVYCTIGGRAELTAKEMAKLDFKQVYLLKGGFAAWHAQGKPVVK